MRVTNNMLVNTLLRNVNSNLSTMQKQQDQLSTGKRVSKPSDDPVAVSKIIKYKTDINELKQYDTNTKDALSWTQTSELAITDISSALQRTRELAVQAANGTNTLEERENIAMEIEQLKEHIIGNGNKTFAGKYIFSSFQTDKKLLNADGTFNINITQNELDNKPTTTYEVGVGETMKVSTNGLDLFGAVIEDDYFTQNIPSEKQEGISSSRSILKGNFDLEEDYTGDNLNITINGTEYTVLTTDLNGTTKAIEKSEIIKRLKEGSNAGPPVIKLSGAADVFFDSEDKLVIQAKIPGSLVISEGSTKFISTFSDGVDTTEATITGANNLDDAAILSENGTYELIVTYNGTVEKISIDMSGLSNVSNFDIALQNELDSKFGSGNLVANLSAGNPFEISTNGTPNDGSTPSLEVRTIKSQTPQLIKDLDDFITALKTDDTAGISAFIGNVDDHLENINSSRSEIGAKTNRLEMILNRIADDNINVTQLLSNSQDVDMAETIMLLKNAENVYKASLSAGARVIQPSLLDFLR